MEPLGTYPEIHIQFCHYTPSLTGVMKMVTLSSWAVPV